MQSAWNQLAVPWLRSPASDRGPLWLLVFGDGKLQLPGSGLSLEATSGSRRVRLVAIGEELRFEAESGARLALAGRRPFLAAAWPAGHELVSGLARRIQLDPSPDLNSKTVSELPGLIILGR